MVYLNDFTLFQDKYLYLNTGNFLELLKKYKTIDNIPGYSSRRTFVIDNASDPWGCDWIKDVIEDNKPGAITAVLVNDKKFADENQHVNARFFPVWAYRYSQRFQDHDSIPSLDKKRNHKVSCLNRIPKMHRIYVYFLLRQLRWNQEIFLSFFGLSADALLGDGAEPCQISLQQIQDELGKDVHDFFQKEIPHFPLSSQKDYDWSNCHQSDVAAFAECYANVCTESAVDVFLPTEKTFKCISAGMLIFPVANQNFVDSLGHLDLHVDYQGLDLAKIDCIADWKSRTLATVERLNQLYDQIEELWNTNRQQLTDNQKKLTGGKIETLLVQNIKDLL
jgi:hypothetical protein